MPDKHLPFSRPWFKNLFFNVMKLSRLWIRVHHWDRRWAIIRSVAHTIFSVSMSHRNSIIILNAESRVPEVTNGWLERTPWQVRMRIWCPGCNKVHHEDPVLRFRPYRLKGV